MNNKTTPKDFFVHIAAAIALYTAAGALINLVLSLIDYSFPDKLANYFSTSSIAWPVSMLIVLIPLLYILEIVLKRDIARMPDKKDLWVRRWRIYLTLFLTGATIIGDLIVLVNTYLNGEITDRFIFKVLAILIIASVIFVYYILDKSADSSKIVAWRKTFAWVGIIVVLISIISGFIIVGSPAKQRALRFDSQRINDLTNIQYQIVSYWQRKAALPSTLTDLIDPIAGYIVPADPNTQQSYEYSILATSSTPLSFQLCAAFDLQSQDNSNFTYPASQGNWSHGAGRVCFTRNVDKSMYPAVKVPIAQ